MSSKIQIKRSSTQTSPPAQLSFGELAYVNAGELDDIYIGDSLGNPVLIGGNQFAKLSSPSLTGAPTAPTPLITNNSTQIATTAYVQNIITQEFTSIANAIVIQGSIDCSTSPNYPIALKGHLYIVSVSGRIGGPLGPQVEVGDQILCIEDSPSSGDHSAVGSKFIVIQVNISGAVSSSSDSSINSSIALFDGISGRIIKDSSVQIQTTDVLLESSSTIPVGSVIKTYVDNAVSSVPQTTYVGSDSINIAASTNEISARLKSIYTTNTDCDVIKVDSSPDAGIRGLYVKTDGVSLKSSSGALYVNLVDCGTF